MTYFVAILLGILSYFDIRYREIPIVLVVIGGGIAMSGSIYDIVQGKPPLEVMLCAIPGIIFLIIHLIFPHQIGVGDGLVLMISELNMTCNDCLIALFFTAILSGIVASILLIMKRNNTKIPFIPFIMMGQIMVIIGEISF